MFELQHVSKTFSLRGNQAVDAVQDISFTVQDGDIFGIIGLSGAGKSTLVRCLNLLERPTGGRVLYNGVDLATLSEKELRAKRHEISMIFQGFNLLSQRTALKNVCYPLEITGVPKAQAVKRARELLQIVDLADRENAYPSQLSGGQKQRVAIARALATDPKVLLCDEATSALDPNTTRSILALLQKINREIGVTIVVITHEMTVVEQICNRVAVLDHGNLAEIGDVEDIFLKPQSEIARELILPKTKAVDVITAGRKLRLVFDGRPALEPIISNLTLECHTAVNILGADTKNIGDKVFGQMVIQLPDDVAAAARVRDFLTKKDIPFEEVSAE